MKKTICFLLCCILVCGLLTIPGNAASFQVTYYSEEIFAGGTMDLFAFTGNNGVKPFTYQWQADASIGDGTSWFNLEKNGDYSGTQTDHLQLKTKTGAYDGWEVIPFRCVVTDAEGTVRYTPNIYMHIYPTENLIPSLQRWGYALYEPTVKGAAGLNTSDYENYTAYAYAGSKLDILCGSTPIQHAVLNNSEVSLTRQIHITENGQTVQTGDNTTYIPYTVGTVTVQVKLHLTIGSHDLGDYDTKTIKITTSKPTITGTAKTKSACSMLRHTYNESQKLASIPKGANVEIVSKEGSYYQVFYNNMVGYVGASLLDTQASYDPVIKDVDVRIAAPVAGKTPAATCQVLTSGCSLYQTDPITWTDKQTGKTMGANDTFREGHSYSVSIWLAAQSGYKFQVDAAGNPKLTGSINGDLMPFIYRAYEQDPEQVIEFYYTFNNVKSEPEYEEHTCKPALVQKVNPTCTKPGHEAYYHCQCGMQYADAAGTQEINTSTWGVIPATGHIVSDWRISPTSHYKVCTDCGDKMVESIHTGGTASCNKKAECTVCGYAYGSTDTEHRWSPTYLYQDAAGHAWICADCKTHSTIEPHTPGPEATQTTPQTCQDCGYIITPAKNHTHELTKHPLLPATCTEEGILEHYTCSGCSDYFNDSEGTNKIPETTPLSIPALGHEADKVWKLDAANHWQICSRCSEVLSDTKLSHEDADSDGKCDTCSWVIGSDITLEVTEPEQSPSAPSDEENPTSVNEDDPQNPGAFPWMILISLGIAVVVGAALLAALFILILVLLKKKK